MCDQIPRAIELRADLVSVLVGGNDLVKLSADPVALAARLGDGIRRLRASGCEVLLLTPFLPRRRASLLLAKRFAIFNSELRSLARTSGAVLLDLETVPPIGDLSLWADDAVHLNSRGHRMLAYEAAARLGVPDAQPLGRLEESLHADDVDESVGRISSRVAAGPCVAVGASPVAGPHGRGRARAQAHGLGHGRWTIGHPSRRVARADVFAWRVSGTVVQPCRAGAFGGTIEV